MRINIFKAIKQSAQSKNISSLHVYPNYYLKNFISPILLSGKYKNDKSIIWRVKINSTG